MRAMMKVVHRDEVERFSRLAWTLFSFWGAKQTSRTLFTGLYNIYIVSNHPSIANAPLSLHGGCTLHNFLRASLLGSWSTQRERAATTHAGPRSLAVRISRSCTAHMVQGCPFPWRFDPASVVWPLVPPSSARSSSHSPERPNDDGLADRKRRRQNAQTLLLSKQALGAHRVAHAPPRINPGARNSSPIGIKNK